LDDICLAGESFEEMMQKLVAFNRIRAAGFLLKAKKCELFQESVEYLGHRVSKEGISMCKNKLDKIQHWPPCKDVAELRTFLGFITYYSPFINDFPKICYPFYQLLHKNAKFQWSQQCQNSFDKFKSLVTSAPILGVPKIYKGPFTLTTDGSLTGLGACLTQEQDGRDVTISWSQTLNAAQKNYCITHTELFAVVEAIEVHNYYLACAPFHLKTDHSSLQWLRSFQNLRGRLARWLEQLAAYSFTVEQVRPITIPHVDALSRIPNRPCSQKCPQCVKVELKENVILIAWTTVELLEHVSAQQIIKDWMKI